MEPIVLTEFETSMVTNFNSEEQKVPFDSIWTSIGGLKSVSDFVHARPVSETHYVLYSSISGRIGQPIPVEIDTFAKLRQWCLGRMEEKKLWETRIRILWGLVPLDVKNKIEADIRAEEKATKAMQRAHRDDRINEPDSWDSG